MVRYNAAATPNKPALRWSCTIGYYLSCPPLVAQDDTIYGIEDTAHEMHAVNPSGTRKRKGSNITPPFTPGPPANLDFPGDFWLPQKTTT
jgi:hypothetical protein